MRNLSEWAQLGIGWQSTSQKYNYYSDRGSKSLKHILKYILITVDMAPKLLKMPK